MHFFDTEKTFSTEESQAKSEAWREIQGTLFSCNMKAVLILLLYFIKKLPLPIHEGHRL